MIKIKNISKQWQNNHKTLDNISLTIKKGEFVVIVGPSGCGKSTLLDIIAGLVKPSSGTIEADGRLGVVFQNPCLLPWRTVFENVALPNEIKKKPIHTNVDDLLKRVGLFEYKEHFPYQLSGGMQQRVAIARSLVTHPTLLLMDEPFGALDMITRESLNNELLALWKTLGFTVVFVTHSIAEAVMLADKVVVLQNKPAIIKDIISIALERPRSPTDQEFQRYISWIQNQFQK